MILTIPIPENTKAPFRSGEAAQEYVKRHYPDAHHYGHGPENTILSNHGDGAKPLGSTFYIDTKWERSKQKEHEDRVWWWAAYLLYLEHDVRTPGEPL